MCVSTALLETGLVPLVGPETTLVLEAPAGLIRVRASCDGGKARLLKITNVSSFVDQLDARIEVAGVGTLSVDIAYGGDSFVLVDGQALGFRLSPNEAPDLAMLGVRVARAANEQLRFDRTRRTNLSTISFCQITGPLQSDSGIVSGTSAVSIRPGKVDRSPCGTGCSAKCFAPAASCEPGKHTLVVRSWALVSSVESNQRLTSRAPRRWFRQSPGAHGSPERISLCCTPMIHGQRDIAWPTHGMSPWCSDSQSAGS